MGIHRLPVFAEFLRWKQRLYFLLGFQTVDTEKLFSSIYCRCIF